MKRSPLSALLLMAAIAGCDTRPFPRARVKCRLPGCDNLTDHNGGYCSPEHCDQHRAGEPKILQHLREQGGMEPKILTDGRVGWLLNYIYTAGIHAATPANAQFGYDERWCYESIEAAMSAFETWDGSAEPIGWHRHIPSGRRRTGGDPLKEHFDEEK